jgi:hypothetical protein
MGEVAVCNIRLYWTVMLGDTLSVSQARALYRLYDMVLGTQVGEIITAYKATTAIGYSLSMLCNYFYS